MRVAYTEVPCRSVLNRVTAPMPFRWSINPYRGCRHRCTYCYARKTHEYLGMDAGLDFESRVLVKVNAPEVLRHELARPGWRRERVAIGTATDPYQPIEGRYRLTRRILQVLAEFHTPASLVTKSTMIVRDIDVLRGLQQAAGITVCISLISLREELLREVEPGTPPAAKRLATLGRLREAGIRAGILLAPILPGLSDRPEEIEAVVRAAKEQGASFVSGAVLRLCEGARERYVPLIIENHPELIGLYRRLYGGGTYATRAYQARQLELVEEMSARWGMAPEEERPRDERPQDERLRDRVSQGSGALHDEDREAAFPTIASRAVASRVAASRVAASRVAASGAVACQATPSQATGSRLATPGQLVLDFGEA